MIRDETEEEGKGHVVKSFNTHIHYSPKEKRQESTEDFSKRSPGPNAF